MTSKHAGYRLTTLVLATTVGYFAMQNLVPGMAARVDAFVDQQFGSWNAAACEADPLGCLDAKAERLAALDQQLDGTLASLRQERQRVNDLLAEQQLLLAKNTAFLEQGRSLYRTAQSRPAAPVPFAGRDYPDLDTFTLQLELLFKEQQGLSVSVDAAEKLQTRLADRREQLRLKRTASPRNGRSSRPSANYCGRT